MRSGDKGRGKDGEPLGNFEPGTDIKAQATVLAEGCWGHLTGAAIRSSTSPTGREPQVWELGVKEVWKVTKPLDRVIHTIAGWPLKISAKYGQIGGSWMYPMKDEKTGEDLVSIGFVLDLDYADATTSAHDLLQQFKTHPLVRRSSTAASASRWGAKALPGGGYWSMPKLSMPGAVLVGDAGGIVDLAVAEGRPPRDQVGACSRPRRSTRRSSAAERASSPTSRRSRTRSSARSSMGQRNTRQPFQKGFLLGRPARQPDDRHERPLPGGRWAWHRNDAEPMFIGNTKDRYPKPDGKYTFDKLSSVFITGNATRDDAPNHIRVQKHVPREIAETWRWMCPAGVYEIPEDAPRGRRRRRRDRQLHQLRAVRGDHRQGRAPDDARGRRRPPVPDHLRAAAAGRETCGSQWC